jgi:peptide-methionine (R)-S-oxide reductase
MQINKRQFLSAAGITAVATLVAPATVFSQTPTRRPAFPLTRTDAEWRRRLSADAYAVLRGHGTERPGSSALNRESRRGIFACAGCSLPLFSSTTKFDSGTGWPSFYRPLPRAIGTTVDRGLGMTRTEVHCARCGGHLGHVFNDGPQPTGLRYCMNGVAMSFIPG